MQKVAKEFNIVQILCQFSAYKFDIGGQEVYFDEMNVYSVFCKPYLSSMDKIDQIW